MLAFDCARFKYNSRWQKINILFNALNGIDRVTNNTRGYIIAEKPFNKVNNIITKEKISNINGKYIEQFLNKIKFENIMDKAKILNWLINNEFSIEKKIMWEENRDLWEKIMQE